MERPSYVMQRYDAQGDDFKGAGPIKFVQQFERPYPHMRLFYVEHSNGWFDVYWVDAELLVPETRTTIVTKEEMQQL